MSLYDTYKHLLGRPYVSGDHDCYGLCRDYYRDNWGIDLPNFARPEDWWNDPNFDLICENLSGAEWTKVGLNPRELKVGDGIIMSLINGRANHVGVYVGNGNFIHHVFGRFSVEEPFTHKWLSRTLMIVRHSEVTSQQEKSAERVDLIHLLPDHVRANFTQQIPSSGT